MTKEDITITDYKRILFGEMPPEFMIEVILRTAFAYILIIAVMRILGPRMEAMISRHEEIVLVTLAASVGILIHNPDRGILPAVVVTAVMVGMQYLSIWILKRSDRAEKSLLDMPDSLVDEGRFNLDHMQRTRIQRERVVSELRGRALVNLAQIQRVYIEANGEFSVMTYEKKQERTGLCLLPDTDKSFRERQQFSDVYSSCKACGNVEKTTAAAKCARCGKDDWERAVITNE